MCIRDRTWTYRICSTPPCSRPTTTSRLSPAQDMAVTSSNSGVAERSSTTLTAGFSPCFSSRSISPMSRVFLPPFSTTSAIRTPSAATRTDWIRPSRCGVRTSSGSPLPSSSRSSRGLSGSRSATHRPSSASQLGVVSRSSSAGPWLRSTGSPSEPPETSDPTYSDLPSRPTPAAVCSSRDTATDRSAVSPSPSAPGAVSGLVSLLPAGIRTSRSLASTKYR